MSCEAFGELLGQRRHGSQPDGRFSWGSDRSQRLGKYQPNKPRTLPEGECQAPGQEQAPLVGLGAPGAQQDAATRAQSKGKASPGSGGDGEQARESEGSGNQNELTRGRGDYRVPGRLLASTSGTKQPASVRGNE